MKQLSERSGSCFFMLKNKEGEHYERILVIDSGGICGRRRVAGIFSRGMLERLEIDVVNGNLSDAALVVIKGRLRDTKHLFDFRFAVSFLQKRDHLKQDFILIEKGVYHFFDLDLYHD